MHARMCTRIYMCMRIYVCGTHIHARQGTLSQFHFSLFVSFCLLLNKKKNTIGQSPLFIHWQNHRSDFLFLLQGGHCWCSCSNTFFSSFWFSYFYYSLPLFLLSFFFLSTQQFLRGLLCFKWYGDSLQDTGVSFFNQPLRMNFYVFAVCFQSIFFHFIYLLSLHFFFFFHRTEIRKRFLHHHTTVCHMRILYIMKVIHLFSSFFFSFCLIIFCCKSRRWILYIYVYMLSLYILSRFKHTFPSWVCVSETSLLWYFTSHFYFAHFQTHSQFFIFSKRRVSLTTGSIRDTQGNTVSFKCQV